MEPLWDESTVREIAERIKADQKKDAADLVARVKRAGREAVRIARDIAANCSDELPVRRITLFGSLAENWVKSSNFDIDLALEGGDLLCANAAYGRLLYSRESDAGDG